MTGLRTYGDPCGIARALDLIGERWALLIVRELVFGPKRFTDLRSGLSGASPNVLSQRLRELEQVGVVRRRTNAGASYELTEWGRELHPILVQLGRWGAQSKTRPDGPLSADALMVALEATFKPQGSARSRAEGEGRVVYEVRLGEDSFAVELEAGRISIARGSPPHPHAQIFSDSASLRSVVFGGASLEGSNVELRGDKNAAKKFLRLFSRPKLRTDSDD